MPGRFSLYQDLSVEENLNFFATIFGTSLKENYDLIRDIYSQIEPFKKRKAGQLSGGMKQKLALSCALIHKPTVLFLDEPTTGVDAVSRKEFWEMLKRLQDKGITILVSTPYMDEAALCDRVALIQNGNIFSIDEPQKIVERFPKKILAIRSDSTYTLIRDLEKFSQCDLVYPFGEYLHYTDKRKDFEIEEIQNYVLAKGHNQVEVKWTTPDIEDCFIDFVSKENGNHY
jgi:ABC-type multidrug transport system ATPase subunit